eukprot:jgi/Psemu1/5739/gm1.5739_g
MLSLFCFGDGNSNNNKSKKSTLGMMAVPNSLAVMDLTARKSSTTLPNPYEKSTSQAAILRFASNSGTTVVSMASKLQQAVPVLA